MDDSEKKRILIADDESSVRSLLKRILSGNYVVFEASNGEEALDVAHREKPDLILMDIMMPKLDGIGACTLIKHDPDTQTIPVIMVTARWQPLDQEYAKDMGADGYLVKPFDTKELMDKTEKFLMSTKSI